MNLAEIPIPCLGHGLRSKRIPVEEWGRFQGLVLDSRIKSRDSTTRSRSDSIPIPTQYAYKIQIQNRDVMMLKKKLTISVRRSKNGLRRTSRLAQNFIKKTKTSMLID